MRIHHRAFIAFVAFIALAGTFAGCASTDSVPKAKKATLTLCPEKDGVRMFRLTGTTLAGATLTGTVTGDENSGYALSVTELEWFNNWVDGWTEAKFLANGTITVARVQGSNGDGVLSIVTPVSVESPSWAKIRYRDTVIAPDTATTQIANRWDRVVAVTAFLAEKNIVCEKTGEKELKDFEERARKRLFPELYGYPEGSRKGSAADRVRKEGVSWDTAYTREEFPEGLRAIRDSGTILRDWEEGFGLFLLAANQGSITNAGPVRVIAKKADK